MRDCDIDMETKMLIRIVSDLNVAEGVKASSDDFIVN